MNAAARSGQKAVLARRPCVRANAAGPWRSRSRIRKPERSLTSTAHSFLNTAKRRAAGIPNKEQPHRYCRHCNDSAAPNAGDDPDTAAAHVAEAQHRAPVKENSKGHLSGGKRRLIGWKLQLAMGFTCLCIQSGPGAKASIAHYRFVCFCFLLEAAYRNCM